MKENDGQDMHIRPLVLKYEREFIGYVKRYGAATVKKVLDKGRDGNIKLKAPLSKKDRFQMIQLLGL